jgi:hypothetical protein
MRVAPVGLFYPDARKAFEMGCKLAARIPPKWLIDLELKDIIEELAGDLF